MVCDFNFVFTPIENRYLFKLNENNEREFDIKLIPKELLGKTTANTKFTLIHIGLVINKQQIKPTRIKYIANENYNNQTSDYIQMLKVDLDHFLTVKVLEILSNAENLSFLPDNIIFINDIDFTQDFSGFINKEEVITLLLFIRDFRMEDHMI